MQSQLKNISVRIISLEFNVIELLVISYELVKRRLHKTNFQTNDFGANQFHNNDRLASKGWPLNVVFLFSFALCAQNHVQRPKTKSP